MEPPASPVAVDEPTEMIYANLNFKIDRAFRRDFKRIAADLDLSLVGLLRSCFYAFVREKASDYSDRSPTLQRLFIDIQIKASDSKSDIGKN